MLVSLARLNVPELRSGIERYRQSDTELIIRAPEPTGSTSYLRLEPDDEKLLELIDGTRTEGEILVENFRHGGGLAFARTHRLIEALGAGGFLKQPRADVYAGLRERLMLGRPSPLIRALSWLTPERLLSFNLYSWRGADAFFDRLHRMGGWMLFNTWFVAITTLAAFAGAGLLIEELISGEYDLFQTADSYLLGLITLAVIDVLIFATHDGSHALAMKHIRRKIIRAGVMAYYFAPVVYVETTDSWMTDRRQRILVSWAGPFSGLLIGGVAALVTLFPPSDFVGEFAFKLATISLMTSFFNLIPLLELDGYYIAVDLLNAPLLRGRSLRFVATELPRRLPNLLRRRDRLEGDQRLLAWFGVGSIVFSAAIAISGVALLARRVVRMFDELWTDDAFYSQPLAIALVIGAAFPFVVAAGTAGYAGAKRPMASLATHVRRRRPGSLSGALRKLTLFRELPDEDIDLLAQHSSWRKAEAGETIVREGEPADEFYLIGSGLASVASEGRGEIRELHDGDFFGEIALLERAPRSASVVALTPMALVVLDAGHFRRWAAEHPGVEAGVRRAMQERDSLRALPLFAGVDEAELDELLGELESVRFREGEAVMAEGEAGDAMYVIAEGTAAVSQGGLHIRDLGPGDYFGELALLTGEPRSATVQAITDLRAYRLSRQVFERLQADAEFEVRSAVYV